MVLSPSAEYRSATDCPYCPSSGHGHALTNPLSGHGSAPLSGWVSRVSSLSQLQTKPDDPSIQIFSSLMSLERRKLLISYGWSKIQFGLKSCVRVQVPIAECGTGLIRWWPYHITLSRFQSHKYKIYHWEKNGLRILFLQGLCDTRYKNTSFRCFHRKIQWVYVALVTCGA